jgi:hypothetical protein
MNAASGSRLFASLFLGLALALLAGCSTPPAHRFAERKQGDTLGRVVLLPVDVEVGELSAGGMREKRDDWTAAVAAHLNAAVTARQTFRAASPWPEEKRAELEAELEDVHAVFQAVTMNQILHQHVPGFPVLEATTGTLVYQIGPIDALLDAQQADAALLLFVRDDYATAGRKGLVALGIVAGIPVQGGFTVSSAAIATRDGRLLWMNFHGSQAGDLREAEGAAEMIARLIEGAPKS